MIKNILCVALTALTFGSLTACTGPVIIGGTAATMYLTKPSTPPAADASLQIAPHASWCYSTLGDQVECFSEPQNVPYERLVMVDPPNLYPLSAEDYSDLLTQVKAQKAAREAAKNPPPALPPDTALIVPAPVQVSPMPLQVAPQATPAPKAAVKKTKKHKKKKKPVSTTQQTAPAPQAVPNEPLSPPAISN